VQKLQEVIRLADQDFVLASSDWSEQCKAAERRSGDSAALAVRTSMDKQVSSLQMEHVRLKSMVDAAEAQAMASQSSLTVVQSHVEKYSRLYDDAKSQLNDVQLHSNEQTIDIGQAYDTVQQYKERLRVLQQRFDDMDQVNRDNVADRNRLLLELQKLKSHRLQQNQLNNSNNERNTSTERSISFASSSNGRTPTNERTPPPRR
jgi:regulator of replication initiation timing